MKTATPEPPGMIHSVFFWLREDLSAQERKDFLAGLHNLAEVKAVSDVFIGPPFATENRFGLEDSYDYALIVHFKDLAAHDAYQADSIHLKFLELNEARWSKVMVYDNAVEQ